MGSVSPDLEPDRAPGTRPSTVRARTPLPPSPVADGVLVPAVAARGIRGAVVSPHWLATEAGVGILRGGGNAVDAAIATNAALAVVAGHSCGLGGDAFWLIRTGEREVVALNGSGRSAGLASIEALHRAGFGAMPVRGAWTVTVPGAIRSWGDAHARHGRLPWAALLAPAIELADAFPASPGWCSATERSAGIFGDGSDWARVYRPDGRGWRVGERVRLPRLAATLRRLAAEGPGDAYEGALGARAAAYLEGAGSPLRAADFAAHASTWEAPIRTAYRGFESLSCPPNSSGVIALELLGILSAVAPPAPHAWASRGLADPTWAHLLLEAARLTMADRDAWVSDPATGAAAVAELLDPGHAAGIVRRIDLRRALQAPPLTAPRGGGTVYLATADASGGAVSMLQSNYAGFGSGLVDPETGIAFQNRGAFFSADPSHANALAPRKRTMHTLAPGMLLRDGRPWILHGSMGGEIQPQVFAQFVSAVVDGRRSIADAVAAPRFAADNERHNGPLEITRLEGGLSPALAAELAARGHRVEWTAPFSSEFGYQHAIELAPGPEPGAGGSLIATTDPRSEGLPGTW